MAKNNDDLIPTVPNTKVKDFLELYDDSARYFNTAYLWDIYNEESRGFKNIIEKEGIALDQSVETEESRRLFALIGNKVKNIKIVYQHPSKGLIYFDFPSAFIVNRQYTTFESTQIWYDNFIKFNLLFNREFLGFNKEQNGVSASDWGDIFELTKPKSFDQSLKLNEFYDTREIFSNMYSESLKNLKNSKMGEGDENWHPEYYLSSFDFYNRATKFKVNAQGYVFIYSGNSLIETQMIRTYYGTPITSFAIDGSNDSIAFYIGEWTHISVKEFGDDQKTPLKFNLKE
ncbi:hypothetical protein [Spiroplasma endosymbiont of Panorpa germanica]|uniref:hypothetical protein n=1 Tax=Spiroplasma endosymbiont of Panorpa germanica TaxID=3066314 RepID=UPI0030D0AAE9